MKKSFKGLLRLTRFNDYAWFVVVSTILGITSAKGQFDWRFVVVLIANWLAVRFAFMVNLVENAPDDAFSPNNTHRNPIAAGWISPKVAQLWALATALLAFTLFALLGGYPLLFGSLILSLGYLYSAKAVRLRSIPFLNTLSQSLMLVGLQFLTGFFTYQTHLTRQWFWPFMFVMSIAIYAGLRYKAFLMRTDAGQSANDPENKIRHLLILAALLAGLFSGYMSFVMLNLIPLWVILVMLVLAALFLLPLIISSRQGDNRPTIQTSLLRHFVQAAAIALLLQYILPWLNQVVNMGIFK